MTIRQEEHLAHIKNTFGQMVTAKYRKGANEHEGELENLGSIAILDEAISENIDQFTYLLTLRDKLVKQ